MKSWILFCEARADFQTAAGLIDRVLAGGAPWIGEALEHNREAVRVWLRDGDREYWDIHRIARAAAELDVRLPQGHFGGEPGAAGAAMARNAFVLARKLATAHQLEAFVLIWDADTQPAERQKGLSQARESGDWPFVRVLALAERSREAWVLAGFEPHDDRERDQLEKHRRALGYSPLEEPHRLDSKTQSKRVLADLTQGNHDRERRCWEESTLDQLRQRGAHSGLAVFLEDVRKTLLPLIVARLSQP